MAKYKKANKIGIVDLGDGYKLIVPEKTNNVNIMVAIGMLAQMWALAEVESGQCDKAKFKLMLNEYVDTILEKVLE